MARLILAAMIVLLTTSSTFAQETVTTASTADEMLRHAGYLASVGDFANARATYYQVLEQFPGTTAVDRAVVGIAKTHLGEQDYRRAILYLEDVLVKSADMAARTEARQLYTTLEQRFRTARTDAEAQAAKLKAEYDDISWFNIFKLFTKLRLRSQMKQAEKDLDQIAGMHNLFNPRLLIPTEYADAGTGTGTATATPTPTATATATATPTPTPTPTATTTTDDERRRAYEILKDEIAALIAMIPQEKLTGETAATPTATAEPTVEPTPEPTSEPATDETTETPAAPASEVVTSTGPTDETTEGKEPDVIIGETSKPETEPTTSAESTPATTESTEPTEVATAVAETVTAPAAATTSTSLGELRDAYMAAYRQYHEALRTRDPNEIAGALNRYRDALRAYQTEHANQMRHRRTIPVPGANSQGNGATGVDGPQAPTSTGDTGTVGGDTGTSTSTQSGVTPLVPYYGPQGNVPTDRAGRVVPTGNSDIKAARRSFQR